MRDDKWVTEHENTQINTFLILLKYICWSLCWRVSNVQQCKLKAMYVGAGWRNGIKIVGCMIQEAYSWPSSLSGQGQKPHVLDAQN